MLLWKYLRRSKSLRQLGLCFDSFVDLELSGGRVARRTGAGGAGPSAGATERARMLGCMNDS